MYTQNQFSCFLIGEGTLPIQCAELLLERGHEVLGVISSDASISSWAKRKDIPHIQQTDNLVAFLSQQPFDYLFSIVNNSVLPKEILELPRQLAINYHDALLPRYAGVNATSWALMHGEKTHGITWHVITAMVDAGNILKQISVEINSDETAFTLNGKCYEAAICSFAELIDDLSSGQAKVRKPNLDERTYFGRYKRPRAGGVLSFNCCAHDIDALVRALDFGPYPNPLGLPKLVIGNDSIVVSKLEVLSDQPKSPPGTIIAIESSFLKVSTASYSVALYQVLTIGGQVLPISDLVARFGLEVGYRFKDIEPDRVKRIERFDALIAKHEAFWVQRLTTLQPITIPYAQRTVSHLKSKQYASVEIPISLELTTFLEKRHPAWNEGEFLEAAFTTYIARIGGTECFDIGFRDVKLQQKMVGLENLFASHVPCRVNIGYEQSFEEVFEAFKKQVELTKLHLTYGRDVVRRYPALRSLSQVDCEQMFPVVVERVEKLDNYQVEPGNELTLVIASDGKECFWFYNTEAFDGDSIARMQEQFAIFLRGIVTDSARCVAEIPLLSDPERHKILVDWNDTQADYPKDKCIHQLFEAIVEQTPDAVAVVFEEEQLTYKELNQRANQLAHHLGNLGVGPEVLVGICVERSLDMVVGLLGILKAGGAYVPLDPEYPTERLSFMLQDAGVQVLLTQARLVKSLPKHNARVVCLDTEERAIALLSESNPINGVVSRNLTYVIYTSGSTGKPKGVQIPHSAVVNFLTSAQHQAGLTPADVVIAVTTISFDIAALEIYLPLLTGGRIHLVTREVASDGSLLGEQIAEAGATLMQATPATWRMLLAAGWNGVPGLKILCGGEALPSDLAQQLLATGAAIWNMYGPTEATIWSTVFEVEATQLFQTSIPIGRPIANTQLYILDRYLQPVPVGVAGELYIGGDGVARGYLNRPELTNEKFISYHAQMRLYKTGDKARYLPDGNIEYLGRFDNQVKIRGFRIELGEIEAAIVQHTAVRETVVIAREDVPDQKYLAAYIVPNHSYAIASTDLRGFLNQKLPDYMIPGVFVVLDALPLTPNGKLDRRALPAPEFQPELQQSLLAPRTPIEEMLTSIWADVLRIEVVGVHQNFFELGGHSLLATQVISRVRDTLGVELPLRSLFEAPTIAELASRVELELKNGQSQEAEPLLPIPRLESIPLSFAQARLWFLDQLQPLSAFYNIPLALRLSGQLNIAAIESSINEIIQRHEALRTNFTTQEGQPVQIIASTLNLKLLVVDLLYLPQSSREIKAQRLAFEEANRPFNLEREPLVRGMALQLGETEYILVLTMHHIISDGWSLGIFVRELIEIYKAFCTGSPPILPLLPVQYADFAVWQRQWLSGEVLKTQLDYWKEQLKNAPNLLELPADRPRKAIQTFQGGYYYAAFDKELSAELTALSKRSGVTLFMTLFAAFQTLLYRLSGEDDIVVGTPVAGRNRREIEGLIGFFVNTLVLRTNLGGDPSFEELLVRVREVALQAYTHQDLPFEQLVQTLQPTRDLSYTPLFQVMFVLDDARVPSVKLPELTVSSYSVEIGTAKFDLTLSMENTADELASVWEYNADLFDKATIARIARHFQTLLEAIVANPQQKVSSLPLLTEGERHQLLVDWNNTTKEYLSDKCIHQLFEEQVELTPDSEAVLFEDKQLTYRELNQRANCLAHHLRNLGVGPEVLVGICVERSLEMVVGLLGILKAGGAYVPLDPASPKERLAHILSDSQVSVLLTQEKLAIEFPENRTRVVCFDTDWEAIVRESAENPVSDVKGSNLAYVIYTSGSTGQPKGVTIEHGSVLNLAKGLHQAIYAAREKSQLRVSLNGFLVFDTSVKQVIQLLYGHTLDIVPESLRFDGAALLSYLQRRQIDVFDCTPSQLGLLISAGLLDSNICPQHVLVGGEPIDESTWQRLITAKNIRFYNVYGPTECTVDATLCLLRASEVKPVIGRPIANAQVYILNSQLQPVPIGVTGELHIGGVGLARGYLNRPDLTAEKFISNPFSDEPGAKLYKTGDLARYLPNGNIEFCGRIDNQVKIRGFRIELGEVEAVLGQHPAVRECVVIAREDETEKKRLVAYVVPSQEHTIAVNDLSRFLKQKLPNYMVPSLFLLLEALPLTPNGKVDRKALTTVEGGTCGVAESFVAPRTPIEELLASIWAEVLGVEQVGIHDNFFEIGGHSLKATQVISRVRDVFSTELPIRCLFEFPTVADLSKQIEDIRSQESNLSTAIPIQPIPREEELALSFAQQRLWFLHQLERQNATYNILSGLHLIGIVDGVALEQSIAEIVARHESLRTTFSTVDGVAVQVIHANANIPVSSVNLEAFPEVERVAEVQRLVQEESQRPFDLAHGPLLRVALLRLGRESHILLLTMHHIVSDGWSMGIFFKELSTLYAAFSQRESAFLPEVPIQYADFAHWQRQWLQGEVLETQLDYWQQQLTGAPPLLDLPTDRPRPPVQTFRGRTQTFELSETLTQQIKKLSSQSGTTLFMTLLAAFITLLGRYSNQEDIVVGSPIASRNRSEIERIIGFFANTLVLRVEISGNPCFRELLRRVRQVTLDAYSHQDLPFEKLVEELQPERNLSYNPLFQVMFVLQNAGYEDWEFPGLILTPLQIENVTAKFDLTLAMEERESGLRGVLEYNSDLFDATTITRMLGHFQMLLAGIVANPEYPISGLPLLTEAERHQLLVEWNDTQAEYPKNKCIHQLFEEQVEKTPDAVALVFEDQQLTYKELNSRANQLAHYLQQLGVRSETLVGICVERSPLMVIGLLGILKAGGAYVPLAPSYPPERLALMLEDARVSVLLTQQARVEGLPLCSGQVVDLDNNELWEKEGVENLTNNVQSENLAYTLYTSGSTGKPKGVAVEHRSVVALLSWATEVFTTEQLAGVLASTSFCFDISVFELFVPLSCGGKIILAENVLHLSTLPAANEVTLINTVPSAIAELVRTKGIPDRVGTVNLAGEVLPQRLGQLIYQQNTIEKLFNLYGPSEDTVYSTYALVKRDGEKAPPIGRPVYNTQVYILDSQLQPVPIGVCGELHIGGAGLARGYLNRSDLTAEKFIPNPFSDDPNAKLYKTGDKVRYLSDGNIEFIGRIDNQVKIRGFRIELSEVEAVLGQHPAVRDCAVITREDETENKCLVAYIVLSQETIIISELRRFLRQKLPNYMVPSAFVLLEAMPLTANGKVDRRALPSPDSSSLSLETRFVPPRTPTEEVLATIWSNLLRLEQVGIHDNFFELGGHSLLAIQVISRLRETFSVELPVRCLFEAPTIAELGELIEASRTQNPSLLPPAIVPVPREGEIPLSFAQQRLWFIEQLEGARGIYNIPLALRLMGKLDKVALEKAIQEVVQRHQVLRTTFERVNGSPVQVIGSTWTGNLLVVDLRGLAEQEQAAEVRRLGKEEALRSFDLVKGPLLRVTLLQLGEESHVLLLTMHHIVSDGWSIGIFLQEFSRLYTAFSRGDASPLSPLSIQYADFADWQRQWLSGEVLERQLNYWQQQLQGIPPLLELPTDRPRPPVQTFQGRSEPFELSAELTQKLKTLTQKAEVTLFMFLLGAFAVLLSRYSGQEDVVVGSPIANRNRLETESLIGFFVNTLVLRTNLTGEPTFQELLGQVRQVTLDAYAHQDVPFKQVVEVLQPERSLSHNPLFQVMFALQNTPKEQLELPGLTLTPVEIESVVAKFDLTLLMEETEQGLKGVWQYNTDLFDATTICRMSGHFQILLEGIVTNPQQRVFELPLLTEAERHQLLVEWNDTRAEFPQDKCIHELFEEQVEKTPDAVAVVFEDEQLTYQELNARANQLAHYLHRLGVKPETLVGICVERSLKMIVGILGILKAGGAYVPLEQTYPQERLEFMLEDSATSVLLTQGKLIENLPIHQVRVIDLDQDWESIAQQSQDNLRNDLNSDNLAYIIYTSGTTGKPKGICCQHIGVVNLLTDFQERKLLSVGDRCSLWTVISFDVSVYEIFSSLLSGGSLFIVPNSVRINAKYYAEWLKVNKISSTYIPPFMLNEIADWLEQASEKVSWRRLLVGVEPIQKQLLARISNQVPNLQIINGYGPSETTICTTLYSVNTEIVSNRNTPIGKPVKNTVVYILNNHLQLVPIGVAGELHIGGAGLARGYLNRPELTSEKFIPNPFSNEPGAILYKTGDLVRYLPDGNIEFLGRIDNQVKIRGFRIELGEVEAVLGHHPAVRECVVVAQRDDVGSKRLVAYVVKSQETLNISELCRFLKQKLPDYIVPSVFVKLEAMPLTPNGKVDRHALPIPDSSHFSLETSFVPPRTPTEAVLAAIWSNLLGLEQVGIYDNFFELGGHSLLATQVISRLRETFSVELPVRCLFEAPTIAELGESIEASRSQNPSLLTPAIVPVPREGEIPLSFAQQRLWFIDQLEGTSGIYNIPLALRLIGKLDKVALERAIQEVVQRHKVLRTTFERVNGSPVQVIGSTWTGNLSVVNLKGLTEEEQAAEVRRLGKEEALRSFDLGKGLLLRVTLLQLGEQSHVLLLTMHHIVSDGWSIGIFLRELSSLYTAFSQGDASPLPNLPIQYTDFADWQRQWLSGEVLESQLNYWKQQLQGIPPLLELPTDRPRPPVQTFQGRSESFELSAELTQKLKTLTQKAEATLFMSLLGAFAVLLSRYSGQEDVVVGSPIANRNRLETESLIGFFVNSLVLRANLTEEPTFQELLKQVRQMALDAYSHQDVPFEQVVEALQPERSLSHSPLFQVMFALQNVPKEKLELPDLTLIPLEIESTVAKFDLTLLMEETEQGLKGVWHYNTDLFDAATICRMSGHFQTLLEAIITNPQQRVSQLPLLTEAERHQLLVEWNDTQAEFSQDKCIHHLFEEQVEKTPDAIAVVFEDQQLTYKELNGHANQLAHYLQKLGVGPEVLVGICVERSPLMVIGLLGILKAGGAYVPLDPSYPQERLALMLEDAQVSLLLSQQTLVEGLPPCSTQVVDLDSDELWVEEGADNLRSLRSNVQSDNLAYVLYTSGSTGKPKGVAVEHRSVVALLSWATEVFALEQLAGVLASTSFCFDISVFELFAPLSCGGKIILAENVLHLPTLPAADEVTLINTVPSAIAELVRTKGIPDRVGTVNLAGEVLPPRLGQLIYQQNTIEKLFNLYGPSEDTVYSTYALVKRDGEKAPPIGRPVYNTQVYILNSQLQPVPIGVTGELHIGGVGLARGYLNKPDLTAEKFISNPFSDEAGAKLYKTGDLARYLPDGNIEFIGRIDNQVKIRGFRIELGEIEAVLSQHRDVQETVVIAQTDETENKCLVVYIVPSQETINISELRRFLKQKLPEYMIPSVFVTLEAIPLTPNGKVDRHALPSPDFSKLSLETSYAPPCSPTEKVLASIWSNVLGVEKVGIHDNFFELGGHSLLATQLLFQISDVFYCELSLRSILEKPTIKKLADHIDLGVQKASPGLPILSTISKYNNWPLSLNQQRRWPCENFSSNRVAANPFVAIRLVGSLDVAILEQVINEVVCRHEAFRTSFTVITGQPTQITKSELILSLPIVNMSHLPKNEREEQVRQHIRQEYQSPFDLSQYPLMRFQLFRMSEQENILFLTIDHIVFDGWSFNILFKEISILYHAFSVGQISPIAKLSTQYSDFVLWQQKRIENKYFHKLLVKRNKLLSKATPLLKLPKMNTESFSSTQQKFVLSPSLHKALDKFNCTQGVTLYMTLIAVFQLLLYFYFNQEDIIIASPFSNRIRKEFRSVIGCFADTQLIRASLSSNLTFRELLNQVRNVVFEAYSCQELPGSLIKLQPPVWDDKFFLLKQVMFELRYLKSQPLSIPNLISSYVPIDIDTTNIALFLIIDVTPEKLSGSFNYRTDLFGTEFIRQMVKDFNLLLEIVIQHPEIQVDSYAAKILKGQGNPIKILSS